MTNRTVGDLCVCLRETFYRAVLLLNMAITIAHAQSGSSLTGRVSDPSGRSVPGAKVLLRNSATLMERTVTTSNDGIYEIDALPVGTYRLLVTATGFRQYTVQVLTIAVATMLTLEVRLELGDVSQEITAKSEAAPIDGSTTSVGHVIDGRTVQEIPLNGRYFLDLTLFAPGSVTPSQNGFSTTPSRGLGALAINTAGNREETVNYRINGITLNNLVYSSILFQPTINTVQELKVDNSTFSAEYGGSSGAIVNVATRSGASSFHGELFEFLRNNALDARNFFTFTSSQPPPFRRHQFGGNLGGPIVKGKTFFFFSYEGLRQLQALDLNGVVLTDAERSSAAPGVIAKLAALIPRPNYIDSGGTARFVGSASGPVDNDQWGIDVTHILDKADQLHAYYGIDRVKSIEPNYFGTTVPGFGHTFRVQKQFVSLNETHAIGQTRVNEASFGFNRQFGTNTPNAQFNPADFGIRNGISQPIGLPQINIAGGALNFGGPSNFPAGRGDTTFVAGDTMSCMCGRHSLKIGGEFRKFLNNNFRIGTGSFNFASVPAFLADAANSFSVTLGNQSSSIAQGELGLFVQTNFKWLPNLTLELGLRYDWNMSPEERYGRFIVFDSRSASLERLGHGNGEVYHQNNTNFQPRLGLAWDPFHDGRTSIRAAYAILVDQPMTSVVTGTSANPPLAVPLTLTGTFGFENAIDLARTAGLAPVTVDQGFNNAYLQSWNFNVQRELSRGIAVRAGYFGSKGTHLILRRNINQPVDGVRPFSAVSSTSSVLPGTLLGNITQAESTGNSNYHALWTSASKSLTRDLQMNLSYTWSKSLDYNSLSSQGVVVQNSYNLRADRGLSSFDARHRFVARAIYALPFHRNRLVENWQLAAVLQMQSGNPVNLVTTNSTITGVAGTVRPDMAGPIPMVRSVDRWFETTALTSVMRFGNLGRNLVIGPGFNNTDLSIMKGMAVDERIRIQIRVESFDLLNHANFGQPGNVVGSPSFGRVTNTRLPTGESGSSRQIQFGIKLMF